MQSIRRAALRAACSSLRTVAVPRQQLAPFAMRISKQNVAMTQLFSRSFSDTGDAPESSATINEKQRNGYTIYIGNMSFDATETHLHEAFSKYGEILSISIPRDPRGLARGFGFVNFAEESSVETAVQNANQSFWHGRRIAVQPRQQLDPSLRQQQQREQRYNPPSAHLYIGNIPYETSDADLNALFRSLSGVTDVRIAIDRKTGWPRGFAHADFESIEAATKAKEEICNHTMGERILRADFTSPPKESPERYRNARDKFVSED